MAGKLTTSFNPVSTSVVTMCTLGNLECNALMPSGVAMRLRKTMLSSFTPWSISTEGTKLDHEDPVWGQGTLNGLYSASSRCEHRI